MKKLDTLRKICTWNCNKHYAYAIKLDGQKMSHYFISFKPTNSNPKTPFRFCLLGFLNQLWPVLWKSPWSLNLNKSQSCPFSVGSSLYYLLPMKYSLAKFSLPFEDQVSSCFCIQFGHTDLCWGQELRGQILSISEHISHHFPFST